MKPTDTDKPKAIRLQPAERLRLATQIMTGLLASGHYTEVTPPPPGAEDEPDEPEVRRFDWGTTWKEDGAWRRFQAHVVDDALSLLKDLEAEVGRGDAHRFGEGRSARAKAGSGASDTQKAPFRSRGANAMKAAPRIVKHLTVAGTPTTTVCGMELQPFYRITHQKTRFAADVKSCTCLGCLRRLAFQSSTRRCAA